MKYLLDTHTVIWTLADDPQLGPDARQVINDSRKDQLAIAGISLLEIAMLVSKGRVFFDQALVEVLQSITKSFVVLPLNASIAAEAVTLPLPQSDPFDRVIVSTARHHQLQLLSKDQALTNSGLARVIW